VARHQEEDEWLPVLKPIYAAARERHAWNRAEAYELTRLEATGQGVCGPELRIADINEHALAVWESTWLGVHSSGAGGWNWRTLVENLPRRPAVLPMAIWYGNDLCGLALGQVSRRRLRGLRHTVTLTYVERRPEPPSVPLRRQVIWLATEAADNYGIIIGARRLRLRAPDRNLLSFYESYGFVTRWKGNTPAFCEREIRP
jgi:hypothetical protein